MKEVERSRLDISHYLKLTDEQVQRIETLTNQVVMENLPVETSWLPRGEAESKYGFRIYQGGVVPGRELRIVRTEGWEAEACAGTHCKTTGEVGLVKIIRTERIQDGVERLFFSAGTPALHHIQNMDTRLRSAANILGCPLEDLEKNLRTLLDQSKSSRKEIDRLKETFARLTAPALSKDVKHVEGVNVLKVKTETMDVDTAIKTCSEMVKGDPNLVTVFVLVDGDAVKIVVMAGVDAIKTGVNAGKLSAAVAEAAGGSGGGKPNFGQGGSTKPERASEALEVVEKTISQQVKRG